MAADLQRVPSSAVGSYRSITPDPEQSVSMWNTLKKSVVNNTLVAVGLRPTRQESRHWDAVKGIVLSKLQDSSPTPQDSNVLIQASHHPKDTPLVRHVSRHAFSVETDGGPVSPGSFMGRSVGVPSGRQMSRQMSVHRPVMTTGRNQVIPLDPKPDLWKVAFNSMRAVSRFRMKDVDEVSVPVKSFNFGDDDDDEDMTDFGSPITPGSKFPTIMEVEEDQFFGFDHVPTSSRVVADGASRVVADGAVEETDFSFKPLKSESVRREKIQGVKKFVNKVTLSGGYFGGSGGLGTITKLLNFRYKNMSPSLQKELDNKLLHKRPYFTYWLMVVHVIIMIIALGVYGFAPYGWDLLERREIVRQTDLSYAAQSKFVVPSVWLGPPQQALVLLGAIFTPCMRRDRQIFDEIENDRQMESNMSGCCVRRDMSGCFQAEQRENCQERFSMFYDVVDNVRAVCGTSPQTCIDPAPGISSGDIWVPSDVLTWPICREDNNANSSLPHLTCEVTSRPCCFGIQADCMLTTREVCDFLNGRFHQDTFLCSQVDCLNEICGLLPFARFNQPDQFYRLWIAIFIHAGLIHLFLSLLFSFFVLRYIEKRLGWLRTAVIYIFSGVGGNLVSAYFTPYNPEVGPAGSVLGIVAYFFVFLIFESPLLERPWIEFLKLVGVSAFFLVLGLIPYVDNYAHIGGFIFGFFISGVLVPYGTFKEIWKLTPNQNEKDFRVYRLIKLLMIFVGLPVVFLLYGVFFVLLYEVQSTAEFFSYFTCVPLTGTLCIDQQIVLRERDSMFIV